MIVAFGTIGIAYAYEETVQLPSEDYKDKNCWAIIWSTQDWEFQCNWGYGEAFVIELPRDGDVIPIDLEDENPFEELFRQLAIPETTETTEDGLGIEDSIEATVTPNPIEELDPEVRRALSRLGECQFGLEGWAAFVNNYTREVPDELPIFTSGLSKQTIISKLAKNFEECRGMTQYPWLSQEYENKYLADVLGLDYLGRSQITSRGNEASLGFQLTKEVTDVEKRAEADKWEAWICDADNLYLGLCPKGFTGTNRGGFTDGADCQLQGQPATEGGTPAVERCPLQELEEFNAAQPTTKEIHEAVQKSVCDTYSKQYAHLADEDKPIWLSHCHE